MAPKQWKSLAKEARRRHAMADVLEVLYRDCYGLATVEVWKRLAQPGMKAEREELARILAASGLLPSLEEGQRMVDLIRRVLERLPNGFHLHEVDGELRAYQRLWGQLCAFSGYLSSEGVPAAPNLDRLRDEVDERLAGRLAAEIYSTIEDEILLAIGKEWIGKANSKPLSGDANLALIGLATFVSQMAMSGSSLLQRLCIRVAQTPDARRMLLAYLWSKSRLESGDRRLTLADLAREWKDWCRKAEEEMGEGLAKEVDQVLRAELVKGIWPPWLPIQETMDQIVQQTRAIWSQLGSLKKAVVKDAAWHRRMQTILDWAGGQAAVQDNAVALERKVNDAVKARLHELLPGVRKGGERKGSVDAEELERRFDSFAGEFRPETRLLGPLGSYASVLQSLSLFRERAGDLVAKLDELSWFLQAESMGGSAYIVTFDQIRGGLADLIDKLKDKYGFRYYTRYSRIGVLARNEMFEDFYRRFEADLEDLIAQNVLNSAGGSSVRKWKQIQVTVQQISLMHRHDFVYDAKERLKAHCRPAVFSKIFRMPPSSAVLDVLASRQDEATLARTIDTRAAGNGTSGNRPFPTVASMPSDTAEAAFEVWHNHTLPEAGNAHSAGDRP